MLFRWSVAPSLAGVLAAATAHAHADRYRLELVRAPAAQTCGGQAELERAVTDRLGRAPFADDGDKVIVATLDRQHDAYVARLFLRDRAGSDRGVRELPPQLACSEVTASMALAISIAVDPLSLAVAAPEPEAREPISIGIGAGAAIASGLAPGVGPAVAVGGGIRSGAAAFLIEGRFSPARSQPHGAGDVRVSSLGVAALPCWWLTHGQLCGAAVASRVSGEGRGYDEVLADTLPVVAAGAHAGLRLRARNPGVSLRLELLRVISRARFLVDDQEAWQSAPWAATVGVDVWGWRL